MNLYHEEELQRVNNEIIYVRDNYLIKTQDNTDKYNITYAKFHNIVELFYPSDLNISSIDHEHEQHEQNVEEDDITDEDIGDYIRSMSSDVCTGDIIYIGSLMKSSHERFAIISPEGELILHDDLMTIMFDKSINTYHPVPYDFIIERKIKYGHLFQYIIKNKDNNIGRDTYNCSFNNWRTKEEVEEIIKYYVEKDLWM